MSADAVDFDQLSIEAGKLFNPNTPVSEKDMFSGRREQIRRVLDVIFQKGQHAIVFGERGVGKTSLANVLSAFISSPVAEDQILATRVNCNRGDDFSTVWMRIFDDMHLIGSTHGVGFTPAVKRIDYGAKSFFSDPKNINPDDVRRALLQIGNSIQPAIIIDEFDRMSQKERRLFADLIKTMSDYALNATIVLIGVGDSVDDIIEEHESVSRALIQIQMPRMAPEEIKAIITNTLEKLGMTIDEGSLNKISLLSKGLPHYTHLIGLHSTRDALDNGSLRITDNNLIEAIKKGIKDAQHSIRIAYYNSVRSSRKDSLFADVLLSCALAEVNELGEFAAQDLRDPMLKVTGKSYSIPAYAQHLNDFSENKRGKVLIKSGERRKFRYKFSDPLMQPFIIMQGLLDGKINSKALI